MTIYVCISIMSHQVDRRTHKERHHAVYHKHRRHRQEHIERSKVVLADTFRHPRTVMIVVLYAHLTLSAVQAASRHPQVTSLAFPEWGMWRTLFYGRELIGFGRAPPVQTQWWSQGRPRRSRDSSKAAECRLWLWLVGTRSFRWCCGRSLSWSSQPPGRSRKRAGRGTLG